MSTRPWSIPQASYDAFPARRPPPLEGSNRTLV